MNCSRRRFLAGSTLGALTLVVSAAAQEAPAPAPARRPPAPRPPVLPADKVQAIVGQSHRNLDEVRKLIGETPLLVNACWDWGGGDFETPLEAAAHTGQRAIAEFLLRHHARPSLFAAAMLGQLGMIRAELERDPRAHEIPGPHGFTLLHCAKAGGVEARPVYDFLLGHGVPEVFQRPLPYQWPPGTKPS